MEEQQNSKGLIPFIFLVLGFAVYVAADQGILKDGLFAGFTPPSPSSPSSPNINSPGRTEDDAENQFEEVGEELKEIKTFAKKTQARITTIMGSLEKMESDVKNETQRLQQIGLNFEKIKRSMASTHPSEYKRLKETDTASVTSWDQFMELTKKSTDQKTAFIVSDTAEMTTFQIVNDFLWKAETLYLLPRGLRLADIIAKYAGNLGAESIAIIFEKDNLSANGRAQVLADFLGQLSRSGIEILTREVSSEEIKSAQGVDILIGLKK